MMKESQNMFWSDINDISRFTENTPSNKEKQARKTAAIILAAVQLSENFIKGLKHLSAYEASSIITSDANWIQKSTDKEFKDSYGKRKPVQVGTVYYIDYGKTFCGELAYFHYGLCVGKREDKVFIVPMTSGTQYFSTCYHPSNNPLANKKYRQALATEGFSKDCVLKIDDAKFISAGRIEKESVTIHKDTLSEIQKQVFQVIFPQLYQEYDNHQKLLTKKEKQINDQKALIARLKNGNNHMKQLLKNNNLL